MSGRRGHRAWFLAVGGVVVTSALLYVLTPRSRGEMRTPDAWLNTEVKPFAFNGLTIEELCAALWRQDIYVENRMEPGDRRVDFAIAEPATRREVLRRLEKATGGRLWMGFCGTCGGPISIYLENADEDAPSDPLLAGK